MPSTSSSQRPKPRSADAGVTLDLWQTLIFETDGSAISEERREIRVDYAISELADLGEAVDREAFKSELNTLSAEITAGHDKGQDLHFGQWVHRALSRVDPDITARIGIAGTAAVGSALDRAFVECPPALLDGSLDVLDELEMRGLKIGLVTNTGLTSSSGYREWFRKVGLMSRFDHMAFSNELAAAKPDRALFDATLRAFGLPSVRALHVGDNLYADVGGAAAIGMTTVWVRGGIESPMKTKAKPDYTIESLMELLPVVDQWLETLVD